MKTSKKTNLNLSTTAQGAMPIDWQIPSDQVWMNNADVAGLAELVAYCEIDGCDGEIWIERHAIYAAWMDCEYEGNIMRFALNSSQHPDVGALLTAQLRAKMTKDDLQHLGFENV